MTNYTDQHQRIACLIKFNLIFPIMLLSCENDKKEASEFEAQRISRSATIELNGPVYEVFPLFGPVREKEWAPGWEPMMIYPSDAVAEEHMIFKTRSQDPQEEDYHWCLTRFAPEKHLVEYTVSTRERIWFIRVACEENGPGTKATVTYTYTGLTSGGNARNLKVLENMFVEDLKDWETAINHYLETGKIIDTGH